MSKLKLILLEERIVLDATVVSHVLHVVNGNDSGPGSLRDAINTANHDSIPDQIVFNLSPSFNGVINLTSGPLVIKNPVNINGQGQVTINGAPGADILDLNASNSVIKGMTIIGQTKGLLGSRDSPQWHQ